MRLLVILIFLTVFCESIADSSMLIKELKVKKVEVTLDIPKSILIIGDSQSTVLTSSGEKITWTWPNLLGQKLKPCGTTIDVVALGGKTSKWMLQNGSKKLKSGYWDRVIIYGGGNDASNMSISLDTTISNFQRLIDIANDSGCDVWVNLGWKIEGKFMDMNILPVGRPANLLKKSSDWIPYIQKRKDLQRLLKEKLTGCQFIEPYDLKSMTSDGIHPTPSGHKLVADYILQTIDTTGCQ